MNEREDIGWQRLDKWLWSARFMRQRSDCAALVGQGGLRINRQPTEKPHARLRVGDVITLPLRGDVITLPLRGDVITLPLRGLGRVIEVRVIEVRALARRRGPASEAAMLYREIPPSGISHPGPACLAGR